MDKNTVTTLVSKLISAEETYPVRHPVLRKGRPITTCRFAGDELPDTFHVGGFLKDKLVAVASFYNANHADHNFIKAAQLRGMAVLDEYHGHGFGKQLVLSGEELVKKKEKITLWMNARVSAVGFYTNLGYHKVGPIFEIPLVGEHYVMFKKI
ncbi:GNAT family N-acetyltransferase [Cellulophaga sp. E16_2]|uniref:GCN5-related N-acetyltransferase n=1 Tax=Cellulophaga algicola (strain DSM 14237 / IC166 / ACAM 630) TaxID=688270 RepID=E6X6N0_CELAD|nr:MULTISPECIES: GNAT family N-acetyltransferase [Cellulophaga]ADV49568.1 GCN5-related N-acetyltransferase [Cellulophaga algicola DSM 14237]MBO0592017.1 GNAT family N-acetyltransferase [Cellulophaga sp. E16_2]